MLRRACLASSRRRAVAHKRRIAWNGSHSSNNSRPFSSVGLVSSSSQQQEQHEPQPQWQNHHPLVISRISSSRQRHYYHNSSNAPTLFRRHKSTLAAAEAEDEDLEDDELELELSSLEEQQSQDQPQQSPPMDTNIDNPRIRRLRNVGIFAHVDAGKTTVTERMLALAGIVQRAGNVDDGNTTTDYLPQERERGITIQAAAIQFPWYNGSGSNNSDQDPAVNISLIDTPGHVDFSVEVNRSVAVLDGAVLVVDSVAGVQAQTQTVWRALTRPTLNNHEPAARAERHEQRHQTHAHQPLPSIAVINKMDKPGANFHASVATLKEKLPGANPMATQWPVWVKQSSLQQQQQQQPNATQEQQWTLDDLVVAETSQLTDDTSEEFAGVLDLVHSRLILWPTCQSNVSVSMVENCVPTVIPIDTTTLQQDDEEDNTQHNNNDVCPITQAARRGRIELMEALAEVDPTMEELYLMEQEPTAHDFTQALRRATLAQRALPVLAAAAVQGKGIEPLLDAIADLLPSPADRLPPALTELSSVLDFERPGSRRKQQQKQPQQPNRSNNNNNCQSFALGHCHNPSLLALAFKVVHMKGRGGSGDGRVVFCRVYSGTLRARDVVQVITPPALGQSAEPPRTERVGGMLEMAGGRFSNLDDGQARAGDVCALVGLKSVVTGDTIYLGGDAKKKASHRVNAHATHQPSFCAGVAAPRPVLTVQLEAESTTEQKRLLDALALFCIEDPSLIVEDTESRTLLSGLGELHIEIALDRLRREHGIEVWTGPPAVKYRETVLERLETDGWFHLDRTIGSNHLQASIQLRIDPMHTGDDACMVLEDPVVYLSKEVLEKLDVLDPDDSLQDFDENDDHFMHDLMEELEVKSPAVKALLQGCRGALKRGPAGYAMANVKCHVTAIECTANDNEPGSLQAAAAHAIHTLLAERQLDACSGMEPKMSVELSVPNDDVGTVLSDLTGRRGTVDDVFLGDNSMSALVKGEVPLVEILGYANTLRSLTGGESSFTSEYKGHSLCKLK